MSKRRGMHSDNCFLICLDQKFLIIFFIQIYAFEFEASWKFYTLSSNGFSAYSCLVLGSRVICSSSSLSWVSDRNCIRHSLIILFHIQLEGSLRFVWLIWWISWRLVYKCWLIFELWSGSVCVFEIDTTVNIVW